MVRAGMPVPDGELGELVDDTLTTFSLRAEIGDAPALIVGVPGAFTPVCTHEHLPPIFREVSRLRSHGLAHNFIVSRSNPWAMAAWRHSFQNADAFRFISDANMGWLRQCGLTQDGRSQFLGDCCARFTMIVTCGIIASLRIEQTPMSLACTTVDVILDDLEAA